jgi:peptidoglycan/xylan/chitin deacetylase (PgdA/CDA1 family)
MLAAASAHAEKNRRLAHKASSVAAEHRNQFAEARTIRGSENSGYVAFTFDDGPHEEHTPKVLETLEHFGVPGTFFVVGWRFDSKRPRVDQRRRVLDDIIARGHDVGNHTWKHRNMKTLSRRRTNWEIDQTATAMARHTGHRPYLFRPPYGSLGRRGKKALARRNYTTVRWNIDALDYRKRLAKGSLERVMRGIRKHQGGVVLLHDTKKWSGALIHEILQSLQNDNCARLASGQKPIVPVTLHYFLRNSNGSPRAIPKQVQKRTARYLKGLKKRCKTPIDKRPKAH